MAGGEEGKVVGKRQHVREGRDGEESECVREKMREGLGA